MALVDAAKAGGYSVRINAWCQDMGSGAIVSFTCNFGPCKRHRTKFHDCHGVFDVSGKTLLGALRKATRSLDRKQKAGWKNVRWTNGGWTEVR